MLATLARHRVEYVLIGGFGAHLHRAAITTDDLDITPRQTAVNLTRLAAALKEMDARLRAPGVPPAGVRIPLDSRTFSLQTTMTFITTYGPFDVALMPDGTGGFDDLIQNAATVLYEGLAIPLAALADIVRSKDAAGRQKDQAVLPDLRRRLREIEAARIGPEEPGESRGHRP